MQFSRYGRTTTNQSQQQAMQCEQQNGNRASISTINKNGLIEIFETGNEPGVSTISRIHRSVTKHKVRGTTQSTSAMEKVIIG